MALSYTPTGPFVDNSTTPPLSAGWANGVETALRWGNPINSGITVASGGTFQIPLPSTSAGLVLIHATSGGAWDTGWVGLYITSGSAVSITTINTQTMGPGNAISAVAAAASGLQLTVTMSGTGSAINADYTVIRGTL